MKPLTILADENITALDDYFGQHDHITLIKTSGRTLTDQIASHRPNALLVRSVAQINQATLPSDHNIGFVGTATLGIDHIDVDFLKKQGIGFCSAVGSSKHSVAQYVITAILTLQPALAHAPATLGIIGLGNIGNTLSAYAKSLGWQVVGYDPFLPKSDINCHDLDKVLACDIVSLHTPLTTDGTHPTHHLINAHTLAKMSANALLINASRGQVVDENALLDDLRTHGRQVVLDVFENEPKISSDILRLLSLATPHIAGYTLDAKMRGTDMVYQAFCRQFGLPILQTMHNLLPVNPFSWQTLHAQLQQGDTSHLPDFYDIKKDNDDLRNQADPDGNIPPERFDALRKHYALKREWLF